MMGIFKRLFGKKDQKQLKPDTCEHCKHLYFNNDGSTACDSPYEKYCLLGYVRVYKEPENADV